jgi:hypothetical protein
MLSEPLTLRPRQPKRGKLGPGRRAAGIVDEQVEAAELGYRPLDDPCRRRRLGQVDGDVEQLAGELAQLGRLAPRGGHDPGALLQQALHGGQAGAEA